MWPFQGNASSGLGAFRKGSGGCYICGQHRCFACPQLFGDVCYNCSHVIEGDGEPFPPLLSPNLFS